MVSEKKFVSPNILKLRELTDKICSSEDVDYFDIVHELKDVLSTCKKVLGVEKNKDKKIRYYELMLSKIDGIVNQK